VIVAYPNPATGSMVKLSKACNFRIYNFMGQFVEEQKNSHLFNVSSYNKGLYFVVIDTGQTIKLMVK
jgi:hypothetical protein